VGKNGRTTAVTTHAGNKATFNSRGGVSTIHTAHGATITHSAGGQRQAVSEHRDATGHVTRVVSTGHGGYVEHGYSRGGHEYMRRTYVGYGGHPYAHVYRGYYYHGGYYYGYVPGYYYGRGFYGWAYNPWPAPFVYGWGWGAAAWYNPYAYYFAPYPVYPSAAFWLTDYLISQNLQAAYAAGAANAAAANAANAAPPPAGYSGGGSDQSSDGNAGQAPAASNTAVTLTPEVKQMIAEEVKAQLAAEQAAAAAPVATTAGASAAPAAAANTDQLPDALDPNLRVFIVSAPLDVTVNGQSCSLSSGDVLMRTENAQGQDNAVGVSVVSSKKEDCASGAAPRVQVSDLQDMHNNFREQMDSGLKSMADNKSKFPNTPDPGGRTNPDGQAAPDLTAASDVQAQQQDADQAEKDVQQASSSGNGGK
jgi:hypothetical protein